MIVIFPKKTPHSEDMLKTSNIKRKPVEQIAINMHYVATLEATLKKKVVSGGAAGWV